MPGATPRVMLAWARDRSGSRVHVGELDRARRAERAPFACPRCGEEVLARLGRERARHFAHRPGSRCALTSPESALHQNAKERLLWLCGEAFAGRRRVRLEARCPGCRRLSPVELAGLGDLACEEGVLGTLRADVLVLRAGQPALALEVRVTHAVDAEKERALAALGVPAVEFDARSNWEREEEGATALACASSLGFPPCPACAAGARAEAGRSRGGEEGLVAELEAYRARGLMGPRPGPPVADPRPLSAAERRALARAFRCPDCGGEALSVGDRLARHACPGAPPRAVAWRGYDDLLVEMGWWRRR